jgi:hypothetical protein
LNKNNFFQDLSFEDLIILKHVLITFEESCDRELSKGNESMKNLLDWSTNMRAKLSPYIAAANMKKFKEIGMVDVD